VVHSSTYVNMNPQESHCRCPKRHQKKQARGRFLPILSGVVIALLPKCPFCIMAYSSAITLCSGATLYDHNPTWVSWISIALAALTLLLVLWNYKGRRTLLAAGLVLAGSFFIIQSELKTGDIPNYYLGCGLLLLGVWANGSLFYFLRKMAALPGAVLKAKSPIG
jgi:hypothetical protein